MKKVIKLIFLALFAAVSFSCNDPLNEETLDNYINVEPTEITATHEEKIVDIAVDANCQWTLSKTAADGVSAAEWFKVDKMSAKGSTTFKVKILANPTAEARTGSIDLKAENASAFITISQAANPNPGEPEEPETPIEPSTYDMPVYQMFEAGSIDIPGVTSWTGVEPAFTNCTVEGNVIKFADGMTIEVASLSEEEGKNQILMVNPSHTNPKKMAGIQPGVVINFNKEAETKGLTVQIPMTNQLEGKVKLSFGCRSFAGDTYSWSSDEGQTWNEIPAENMKKAASNATFRTVYFEIPSDKKVEAGKPLMFRIALTANQIRFTTGVALEYTEVAMSTLPAQNNTTVVISEGFDSTKDANGSAIEVPGYMKYITSGNTKNNTDTGLLTLENTALSFLHSTARPGFAQIGYSDAEQIAQAGYNGEMTMKVGDRLKEMGIAKADLKISFKATGHTTAFETPGDAKIIIKSGDAVVAGVETLAIDKWTEYTLNVADADQSTVLVMTSEVPANKRNASNKEADDAPCDLADMTFFIDDLLVEVAGEGSSEPTPSVPLTLEFDFSVTPLEGWPTAADKNTTLAGGVDCKYPLNGVDYMFNCADCTGAGSGNIWWDAEKACFRINAERRFLSLPAVDGKKLVKVEVYSIPAGTSQGFGITADEIGDTSVKKDDYTYVTGGEKQVPALKEEEPKVLTYNLTGTEAGKVYRFFSYQGSCWFNKLILTYE